MQNSDVLFKALIEIAVDGIMVIDETGLIQVYNRACARMFGYQTAEVVGQNVKMLMPPPYHAEHDDYLAHYRETGERRIIGIGREVVGRRKNGTTFAMYLSVGEGRFNDRRIFLGIVHDISQRKASEQRIQELQKELLHATRLSTTGQLGAALAHELNQPLTAILNYSGILQDLAKTDDGDGGPVVREIADQIAEQTVRAGEIIKRLRGFVSKREPDSHRQDLNPIIEEAIALGFVGAADANVKLRTKLAKGLPHVSVDKVQIQQVMINLVRNAVEAMQETSKRILTVATGREDSGFVYVSVADTGPGFAKEIAQSLFQPFLTTKASGLGIGLSICRTIIESHGGRLWAESNADGGVTFRFRLPLNEDTRGNDG